MCIGPCLALAHVPFTCHPLLAGPVGPFPTTPQGCNCTDLPNAVHFDPEAHHGPLLNRCLCIVNCTLVLPGSHVKSPALLQPVAAGCHVVNGQRVQNMCVEHGHGPRHSNTPAQRLQLEELKAEKHGPWRQAVTSSPYWLAGSSIPSLCRPRVIVGHGA